MKCLVAFFYFFFVLVISAQEPVSIHLSERDGVPDKEFYNIIEDSHGFIWLCADKGLFRYDGKSFTNYTNTEQRGLSVFGVQEDAKGRIWCNNISGQFFYIENNTLHTFIDLNKQLKGELALFVVKNDCLIIATLNTIYKVNRATKAITKLYTTSLSFSRPYIDQENMYLATSDSIGVLDKNNRYKNVLPIKLDTQNKINKPAFTGRPYLFKCNSKFFLLQNENHKNTCFKIDFNAKKKVKQLGIEAIDKNIIYNFFESQNKLWITTNNGVFVFSLINDAFRFERQFLKGKKVTKVIKDKNENYWFSTLNNGLYVLPNIYIETYSLSKTNQNISSLEKVDHNQLLLGLNSGAISLFNTNTNQENKLLPSGKTKISALVYNPKKKISYIGKDVGGYLLNHETLKLKKISLGASVKSMSVLENNKILILDYRSTLLLKPNDNSIKCVVANRRPYTSFYSSKKYAYVGYVDGLVAYDSLWNAKTITYKNKPIYGISISETSNGMLWVGTFKDGVFGIKNNKVQFHFTTKNGLASNKVEIIKAHKNTLWVATDNGIQKLDVTSQHFKTLKKRDGVLSYAISGIEIIGDKVYFASNKGLFSVHQTKAFKSQKLPKVYFTQVKFNNLSVSIKPKYNLKHNENTIKIGFNVNGFQFNQKGQYKYRLLGLNKTWTTTETGVNTVLYNSLPSGEYTFEVIPFFTSKKDEGALQTLHFTIAKPFWKMWWFGIAVFLLILSSIILYFRIKIKKEELQRQQEIKQLSIDNELIALKLENLRSQMNPHFIFNALNSIQEYIVLNQKKLASAYLGKFSDLIRTYLNHSAKGKITLQEEINCLNMYLELEKLRFEDKLEYSVNYSGSISSEGIYIPTMLVQPYVENAIKHGLLHRKTDRKLRINFYCNSKNRMIECTIEDNGVGRNEAHKFKARSGKTHKAFATKATEDRLILLNYGKEKKAGVIISDLYKNNMPSGTQVDISIPYTTH